MIQQDNQIASLSERIRSLVSEVEKWRQREESTTVKLGKDKETIIEGRVFITSTHSVVVAKHVVRLYSNSALVLGLFSVNSVL